jgi:hypothetical protein
MEGNYNTVTTGLSTADHGPETLEGRATALLSA